MITFAKVLRVTPGILGLRFKRSPRGIIDSVFSIPEISPWQVRPELERFADIVAKLNASAVLEIGTANGGTLCVFSRLARPDAVIVSVDFPGDPRFGIGYGGARSLLYRAFSKSSQRMHLIRGDSHLSKTVSEVRKRCPCFDHIFIDGDHTYEGVKEDFSNFSPLIRSGGIIAFHDIIGEHSPESGFEVARFWNEIKSSFRHEEIVENRSQGWAGIGVLYC